MILDLRPTDVEAKDEHADDLVVFAKRLSLSTETVRNHLRSVFRELNAHTRVEAIAAAQRFGLLASPPWTPRD